MGSPPEVVDSFSAGTRDRVQDANLEKNPTQVADEHGILPHHLKRLFLYCSLFPFGYEFRKDELVQLWIAEGFIRERQGERMEDTAGEHFNSLEKEGFFVFSRCDFTMDFDSVHSAPADNPSNFLYKVNSSKHSLLDHTNFPGIYFKASDGKLNEASKMTRHLSLINEDIDGMAFGIFQDFKHLRTLHMLSCRGSFMKHVPRDLCFTLTFLRTLNLSGTLISELPTAIGNVKSLRYVDASHTRIARLPESIDSLCNLQTIKLRDCTHFVELPKGMKKLTNLRHIDLDIIRQLDSMPAHLGNLRNLQTLSAFLVGRDDGCHVGELKNLNDLKGALNISRLENVLSKKEAEEAALIDKKCLHTLELRWSNMFAEHAEQEEKILECLQPHPGLKVLHIQQYSGSVLPTWICNPAFADLVAITLYRCRNCELLPCMGQLPALKSLSIIEMNKVKQIDHQFLRNRPGEYAFPKLERLEVDIMLSLEEWEHVQVGDLPSLVKLSVDSCPELVTLPPLSCLQSLKHLEFRRCPKILSLPGDGLPPSLESFLIVDCLELKEWCLKSEHWSMICHTPSTWFDDIDHKEVKMAGIGELAVGGAVGVAFSALYDGVSALVIKSKQFEPLLKDLKATLDHLKPLMQQIEDGTRELGHPNESVYFKKQVEEGERLIAKLSTVGSWNLLKPHYSNKLVELGRSLSNMVLKLLLQGGRDGQHILATVRSIERKWIQNEMHGQVQNQNALGGGETGATAPYPPSSPIGLDKPLRELKMKLLNNDRVSMLSVTAPGGSGKTTLAQMFCHDQEVKDKFSNRIFFATVSNKPHLDALQTSLQQFLKEVEEKDALLVLDDVWPDSPETSKTFLAELYQLSKGSSYKILVTSRSLPKHGSHYPLDPLTDDEAMTLLKNCTSPDHSSGAIDELLKQIVKYCKRSPLAITVVGKSLFKDSIEIWKEKVIEWSKSPSILDEYDILLVRLQTSLDVLSENKPILKECFIDLASLPEDGRIPAGVLIDMWSELHGLHEDTSSIAKLQDLDKHNLVKLVVTSKESNHVDRCYSEQSVAQHDMLRELALHQIRQDPVGESKRLIIDICGDVLPKQWTQLTQEKDKLTETRLLSISTDGEFSSKWDDMHLPKAEVLILNFQTKNYTLPKFNRKMSEALKVVIVRNHGLSPAELSNLDLLSSLPNLKRVRLERISISSISLTKQKKLQSLEKISLFMCNIGQPSGNNSIRFFEALPNLVEINIDYCNDLKELPAELCDLKYLKKLVITNCHNLSALPEEIGKLSNLEVLRLRSCTMLETLKDSITNLKNLTFLDISDCFSIKELPEDIGQLSKLERINMRQCTRLPELPISILNLENILKEVICDEETEELWEPFKMMEDLHTRVVKEEFNLRWLH